VGAGGGDPGVHPGGFDPFSPTRAAEGRGLSSPIMRDLGGSPTAEDGDGGAVMTLVLPAAEA